MTFKFNDETVLGLKGISYIIHTDDGEAHIRQQQPCYGELRKYEKTHAGECTQPANAKPGDLHSPFPAGHPAALEINFLGRLYGVSMSPLTDRLFEGFWNKNSPWISGFNEVEFIKTKQGNIGAIRIRNADIDTTVLVNALKNFNATLSKAKDWCDLVDNGLTEVEASGAIMLNGGCGLTQGAMQTGYYSGPKIFSARRFFQQKPNDLTGGLLKDRIDYNRTLMADPFTAMGDEAARGTVWQTAALEAGLHKFGTPAKPMKEIVSIVKTVFEKAIEREEAPVETPFIWKTTSGKTRYEHTIADGR